MAASYVGKPELQDSFQELKCNVQVKGNQADTTFVDPQNDRKAKVVVDISIQNLQKFYEYFNQKLKFFNKRQQQDLCCGQQSHQFPEVPSSFQELYEIAKQFYGQCHVCACVEENKHILIRSQQNWINAIEDGILRAWDFKINVHIVNHQLN